MKIEYWLRGSRPFYQLFGLIPLFIGMLYGYYLTDVFDFSSFLFAFCSILIFNIGFAYINDYIDYEVDELNIDYTFFSGGSRMLPLKYLEKEHLLIAGIILWNTSFLITLIAFFILNISVYAIFFHVLILLLGFIHSSPPLKLSYRYGGEAILGVSPLAIAFYGYVMQSSSTNLNLILLILPVVFITFAYFIINQFYDHRADRICDKRTLFNYFKRRKTIYLVWTMLLLSQIVTFINFFLGVYNLYIFIVSILNFVPIGYVAYLLSKEFYDAYHTKNIKKVSFAITVHYIFFTVVLITFLLFF